MQPLSRISGALLLLTVAVLGFANAPLGTVIENVSMSTLEGGQHKLLAETNVSVFIFIKPGLEHSHTALVQIVQCQADLAGKPVHWTAVVSSRIPKADVAEEVKATGLSMPVLVDQGDALYGRLGVILHPAMGITDEKHKLLAYQPFAKVNYAAVVRARILHALKEITDDELEQVIKPPPVVLNPDASIAQRYFKLAERQFQAGHYEVALTNLTKSLDKFPTPQAHALRGRILAVQSNRVEALRAYEAALKLEPTNAAALEGIKALPPK